MNSNEFHLINQRFDDVGKRFDDLRDELKSELSDIKGTLKDIQTSYQSQKFICNNRLTTLEHFKTRILGITTGVSLIAGLIIGKLVI